MEAGSSTVDRIVAGAITALGRYGLHKFSMSDVCAEAGVSRGTLYRYFKSKDQVLEAVGEHIERSLRFVLRRAVATRPEPERRLEVVLQAMMDYRLHNPETVRIIETEPGFALHFLTRQFPSALVIVADVLEPVLAAAPPVRQGVMTKRQLAEVFLRIITSTFLVPSPGSERTAKRVAAMWDALLAAHAAEHEHGKRPPRAAV